MRKHDSPAEKLKQDSHYSSHWLKLVLVLQFFILAWQFNPAPSTNGDNAKYFILGTALSEMKGYKQIHLPDEPVETQYPILFPALLGAIQLISSTIFLSKIVLALMSVLVILLLFYFGRDYLGFLLAPILFLCVTSSLLSEYSVILMSELPYLLLTLLSLCYYDRSIRKPADKYLFVLAVVVSVLPVHCKSVGLAFSATFIIVTLFSKRYSYSIAHLALLAATIIAYRSFTSWDNPYILQLFQRSSYNPEMGYATIGELIMRITVNAKKYSAFLFGNVMWPFLYTFPVFIRGAVSLPCTVLIVIGMVRIFFTPLRLISIYMLIYFGIISLWQTQWSSMRFLAGVTPFLFVFCLTGIDTLVNLKNFERGRLLIRSMQHSILLDFAHPTLKRQLVIWIVACLIILANITHLSTHVYRNKLLTRDWNNYYHCADWLRINTPENAIIMSRKPELLFLRAKRKGIAYPFTHNVEKMMDVMKKENIRFIVCDNFFWTKTTIRYLYPVIRSYPDRFRVVYAVKNPDTYVLELVN